MKTAKGIVWFRQDLRLHDNEAIRDASLAVEAILPIYVIDQRLFESKTKYGFRKTGVYRAKFILESIRDLRKSLRSRGSDLIVRYGLPEEIIAQIAREQKTSAVFCNRERTQEELDVQNSLENKLWAIGQELRFSRGKMLFYTADLPFPVTHTPDKFTTFRKEVEKIVPIRIPLDNSTIEYREIPDDMEVGDIPILEELGFSAEDIEKANQSNIIGGEQAALKRLQDYLWETDHIARYKETRNEMLGYDFSSKLSYYLAQGCISPKLIYAEIKKYEQERVENESTYWLIFELYWRDFFRLMAKKHGSLIFLKGGIKGIVRDDLTENMDLFRLWAEGRTGVPVIDANMIELNKTGYMSNRGRQVVASFLVNDLKINWQIGAEYFESLLIDYDPCSNYGNWNYLAGVGSDPRENRYFNTTLQAKKYDMNGAYVCNWIPQLSKLSADYVHEPHTLSDDQQEEFDFILGKHYPKPVINLQARV